jgi:hypothetical protein
MIFGNDFQGENTIKLVHVSETYGLLEIGMDEIGGK